MNYLLIIFGAYLFGSIPFGYIVAKLWGIDDIRKHGSGNTGATNVYRVLGPAAGITAALGDIAKGMATVYLARFLTDIFLWEIIAGLIAIAGHNWSFFISFKGGKGVATSAGVLIAISPIVTLFCIIAFLLGLSLTKYVSVGSMSAGAAAPIVAIITGQSVELIIFCFIAAIGVYYRHIENIKRLRNGTESKVGKGFRRK